MNSKRISIIAAATILLLSAFSASPTAIFSDTTTMPVKGSVTMVDLGAASCIPCKMMAPILENLEKRYRGKAVIAFIDLRYDRDASRRVNVQAIPTQIFFDKNGREVARHTGFMSEDAIVNQLKTMGVQ